MTRPQPSWSAVLLRTLPRATPLHRMWAGTKLVVLLAITVTCLALPGWGAVAALIGVVAVAGATARVPMSVVPRPPIWFWLLLAVGAAVALLGAGLALYVQALVISFGVLGLGLLLGWTTPLDEIPPALASLGRPLVRVGLPVETWAAAVGISLRTLPLLVEEIRVITAVQRARRPPSAPRIQALRRAARDGVDLCVTLLAVTVRRAAEIGTATAARGGTPLVARRAVHLVGADLAAFGAAALTVAAAALYP
ncbi:MAG TPA: energy-coupling factor transporter transmembrane protein EcfT [Amnibacterium sp.]|nr:energy-coupling factor transporter transmembrane protein EcfT [Amnibacterium sp.]